MDPGIDLRDVVFVAKTQAQKEAVDVFSVSGLDPELSERIKQTPDEASMFVCVGRADPASTYFTDPMDPNSRITLLPDNGTGEFHPANEIHQKNMLKEARYQWSVRCLGFPLNPKWSDVEPYYLREHQSGHTLTYMVKDAGGVPQTYWVDEVPEDTTVLKFVSPDGQTLCIGRDVSKSYSPLSLQQTKKDLASCTNYPENRFDYRGSTQLAFIWLFLFGSEYNRMIIKSFAEKPCVFYVNVERTRLTLAYNDRAID